MKRASALSAGEGDSAPSRPGSLARAESKLRQRQPSDRNELYLSPQAKAEPRLRLVHGGTDTAERSHPAARIYIANDGGPLRTIVGDGHRHFVGEEHSTKTGLSNPYEGPTEHALIVESELRADVLDYRTQAFRKKLMVGNEAREWICDHLRHVRAGGTDFVEAIECKPNISFISDPHERAKMAAVAKVCAALGWRFRVLYESGIRGGGERQLNFGEIYARKTVTISQGCLNTFERLVLRTPEMTFGALRTALHYERVRGTAVAHALICVGRVQFDLDRYLSDASPVRLLPAPEFSSLIRF